MASVPDHKQSLLDWANSKMAMMQPQPWPKDSKLIRDPVHGYIVLEPYEVAILDTPILQRLRHIHQTALAYFVYPGATHTRFDHSLGVLKVADTMVKTLQANKPAVPIEEGTRREIRLAALLHDVGHVIFSHLGESILEAQFPDLKEELGRDQNFPETSALGERLSWLIITSGSFREHLESILAYYNLSQEIQVDKVAGYILGRAPEGEEDKAEIINGPFDADKVDYLLRDCHFCGIRADVDAERLYYTLRILNRQSPSKYEGRHHLVVDQSGIPILEQILFNKMMLYTAIYHHQKIRALECMVKGIFEEIFKLSDESLRFRAVGDFFNMAEHEFFSRCLSNRYLRNRAEAILNRSLLRRAMVISMAAVTDDSRTNLIALQKTGIAPFKQMRRHRVRVFDNLPKEHRTSPEDLWIDLPRGTEKLQEDAKLCLVSYGPDEDPVPLAGGEEEKGGADIFRIGDWIKSYTENRWKGHVFYNGERERGEDQANPEPKRLKAAADATRKYLGKNPFRLQFKDEALKWAKIPL